MSPPQLYFKQMLRERDSMDPLGPRSFRGVRSGGEAGLVSIVLPVFNGERHLGEAIESIVRQTYTQWELIVVDDGSTDSTPDVAQGYAEKDKRIIYLRQENMKLPAALNTGYEAARGEYLTWTSDDNRLKPIFLETLVGEMDRRPDVDMLYGNIEIIGDAGNVLRDHPYWANAQNPPGSGSIYLTPDVSLLHAYNMAGAAFLYRRRVMELIGRYSTHWYTCEDYDFSLRVNAQMKLRHTTALEPLYEYRLHDDSLSAKASELGIVTRASHMLVMDDARWDINTGPVAWKFDWRTDSSGYVGAFAGWSQWTEKKCDHVLKEHEKSEHWYIPVVYMCVVDKMADAKLPPAPEAANMTVRILLYIGNDALADDVDSGWDLCLAWTDQEKFAADPNEALRWLRADSLDPLWHAARVKATATFAMEWEERMNSLPVPELDLSIVICSNRMTDYLKRSVESLRELKAPNRNFEIIVVNNDPDRIDFSPIVDDWNAQAKPVAPIRIVSCHPAGLCHARNAGLVAAKGDVVLYLDDDIVADSGLVEGILAAYESDDELAVVGGTIEVKEPSPKPFWYGPELAGHWSEFTPKQDAPYRCEGWHEYPYGANWSAKRDVLWKVGGFRNRYGRGGRVSNAGEEVVAALSAHRLGYAVGSTGAAKVLHVVGQDRFTLKQLILTSLGGYKNFVTLIREGRIPVRLGALGLLLRAGYRLLLVIAPNRDTLPKRLGNLVLSVTLVYASWLVFKEKCQRLARHPVLYDRE